MPCKIENTKKAWNGRSKPLKFSIYADNRCGVPVWRPLLYQLSYTPKYLVAAKWDSFTCREYHSINTCFCQELLTRNTRRKCKSRVRKCQATCGKVRFLDKARGRHVLIAFHSTNNHTWYARLWRGFDHVFGIENRATHFFRRLRCGCVGQQKNEKSHRASRKMKYCLQMINF